MASDFTKITDESTNSYHRSAFPFLWFRGCNPLLAVFFVAFLVRAVFVVHYGPILTNDSTYYLNVAQGILEGHGLGLPYRAPPVYPLFLAAVTSVCSSHWAIIWVQAVVGALTCVVWAATCQRLFQPKLALILGLAVALYIPMAAFCVTVLRETLIGLGVSLVTYCLVRLIQERSVRWAWSMGVSCVFTVFCQPTFVFFPLWAGIGLARETRKCKDAFRYVMPALLSLAIAIGLWGARNYRATSHFIPLSADHLGFFLLEGVMDGNENEKALTPDQIRFLNLAVDDPYNTYAGMRDHYWGIGKESGTGGLERKLADGPVLFSRALRLIIHQPYKYLRFSLKRLHRLWCKDLWVERATDGYLNLRPLDRLRETRQISALGVVALIYAFGYSGLIGMAVFGKRLHGLLVPVVTLLSFHMWVHAETRYALAIHPHLLIFSVLAVSYLWQRFFQRRHTQEIAAAVIKPC